ncbi:MAG TPA: hypothetical protein VGJ40_05155 [Gaiellaceae bacterium]
MSRRNRNIIKSLIFGVAVAAFAAPTALAEPRGPGNPVLAPAASTSMSPDDRAFNRGGPALEPRNISPDDRAAYRGTPSLKQPVVSVSPDDRSFYRGVESPSKPVSVSVSPDDRSFYRGVKTPNQPMSIRISSPDDRAFYRGVETPSTPVSLTISASDDFQWTDAGLGAAMTLALTLLLGAGALVIRHHRHRLATY